ncbi:DUF2156 domain-containing protein [Geobacter sp. FeAm09]|uniref:DUF2156 domain-containing protein n=1 Tax=Geobacter sp. FeAm09 TaxID=2597769 RepID=UPI0011F037ED|nr:phosphatidylglycerol lysyltransferase domain-containing protein [Geobacter sp. FeAm09]QEM68036.1 DUF2156 domain-containing protein [Geobacter sp. FeAm09]
MEIPSYPDSRPLDLADKSLLDGRFSVLQPRISELTFAGLYLFRAAHDYRLAMVGDALLVLGRGYSGERYCLPPVGGAVEAALDAVWNDGLELYGADETLAAQCLKRGGVTAAEDRDSFDYLYLREELATLPGHRFHKKKNRISYFAARHEYRVALFSEQHRAGCHRLLEVWRGVNDDGGAATALGGELAAAAEALEMAERLGLEGVVVTVAGEVTAFSLGERLNAGTAVCHFEKADPFMEGAAQLVNREFSRLLFTECRFVNREQDLGDGGLRNAKLSYHPAELIKKFRIRRTPQMNA